MTNLSTGSLAIPQRREYLRTWEMIIDMIEKYDPATAAFFAVALLADSSYQNKQLQEMLVAFQDPKSPYDVNIPDEDLDE